MKDNPDWLIDLTIKIKSADYLDEKLKRNKMNKSKWFLDKPKIWFLILVWTSSVSADDHFCSPCKPDVPAGKSK